MSSHWLLGGQNSLWSPAIEGFSLQGLGCHLSNLPSAIFLFGKREDPLHPLWATACKIMHLLLLRPAYGEVIYVLEGSGNIAFHYQ